MKAPLLACCIWLITVSAVAQMASSQPPDQNLYAVALKASILTMEKEWGHIKDNPGQSQTDYGHTVVEKDTLITDALPTTFEGHVVEYLDDQAQIQRYNRLGESYAILKVQPIQNDGAALKINVLVYWISYRSIGFNMSFQTGAMSSSAMTATNTNSL